MRGLKRATAAAGGNERGVIAPITALLMVAVLGMTAFTVDTAMVYAEHAQVQNGADAAALAVAQECSTAATPCEPDQQSTAAGYANGNALDKRSYVVKADADPAARTVEVTTQSQTPAQALTPGGTNSFPLHFAAVLGISSTNIEATARAAWTYPGTAKGFPLALSRSCWNLGPTTSSALTLQKITWKPNTSCTNASGDKVPGGWGWLTNTAETPCEATTAVGNVASSNPGNDPPKTCKDVLKGWIDTITAGGKVHVLFPIFDSASGTGNTGTFQIVGYGTFRIFGWNLGESAGPYKFRNEAKDPYMTNKLACSDGADRCIIGGFVRYQTSGGGGGGLNFGTSSVSLTK